jgi:hypothetical protein
MNVQRFASTVFMFVGFSLTATWWIFYKNLVQYVCYKAVELRNTVYFGFMPPNEGLVLTQLKWICTYKNSLIMQGHILLHCTS